MRHEKRSTGHVSADGEQRLLLNVTRYGGIAIRGSEIAICIPQMDQDFNFMSVGATDIHYSLSLTATRTAHERMYAQQQ